MAPRRTTCRYFSRPYYHPLAIPLIPSYSSPYYYPHRSVLYTPTELRAYRATRLRSRQNKSGAPERRPAVKRLVISLFLLSLTLGRLDPHLVSLNCSPVSATLERRLERQPKIAGRRLMHLERRLERRLERQPCHKPAVSKPKRAPERTRNAPR